MADTSLRPDANVRLSFDAFELDEANARLTRQGQPIPLAPRALAVLCALARQPGQLVTKNALLDGVWGHQHVSESALKNIISEIRAALDDDARQPRYIETASRFGYRFIGSASPSPSGSGSNGAGSNGERAHSGPRVVSASPTLTQPSPATAPSMIGREAALAKMRECWRKAQAGERQLLWIVGEAGVGKTTLLESFVSELDANIAAFGRCVEHFGTGEPYLPVIEVIREICKLEPDLATMMRTVAPTWLIQMPWLISEPERAALHRELAGAHPDRMLREMRELMERFSVNRPIVFILEDMHWSDLGTLRMMEHYARRPSPAPPILWIASFRLTQIIAENHPLRDLRQELRLHKLCEEILLDPFSETEVDEYLARRLPQVRFPHSFVKRLHAHTDGLPLFVTNVTDTLVAQAQNDPSLAEQWLQASASTPLPVPESLAGVIEKQASRLAPEVQVLLEAASVCGVEFRAGTVADMLGRDPAWVRERCDDLVRRQIWLRQVAILELPDGGFDSRYAFLHALYQHVFYHRLAMSQRVDSHRRAARSLKLNSVIGENIVPAELASHHERGHEFPAAISAYAEAAGMALAHFAPKDAAFLASHALSLVGRCADNEERTERELALNAHAGVAASQLHGIASPQARAAFERVRELCDRLPQTPQRAITLNGLGWIFYTRGEFDEALALAKRLEDVAIRFDDAVLQVLACNLAGVSLMNQGKLAAGCEALERGLATWLAMGDSPPHAAFVIDPEVSIRLNLAFPLAGYGFADRAREHYRIGNERAQRIGHPMALMLVHWAGGMMEARLQDYPAVARNAELLTKLVETVMLPQGRGPAIWMSGYAQAQLGDPQAGYRRIHEGYAWHERLGMYAGCTEALGYAVEALILQGDLVRARTELVEALQLAQRINERLSIPYLKLLESRIELGEKNLVAARAAARESLQEARNQDALGLELNACVALAELPDADPDDLSALREIHGRMSEGFDTAMYLRAAALLGKAG